MAEGSAGERSSPSLANDLHEGRRNMASEESGGPLGHWLIMKNASQRSLPGKKTPEKGTLEGSGSLYSMTKSMAWSIIDRSLRVPLLKRNLVSTC